MVRPSLFATMNADKVREFSAILGYAIEQVNLDLSEPQSLDLEEIIRAKAQAAFAALGQPVLVEDTSLTFMAWNGLPGPFIRWFVHTVGNQGMVNMLAGQTDRRAVAQTAVAYTDANGTHVFVGELRGTIATAVRGDKDFGWGPIFEPEGSEQTFGEMGPAAKQTISMRTLALGQLHDFLAIA